jgi:hypothetical protein
VTGALRAVVALLCAYEATAIASRRVPTISHMCATRPWLAGVIVGGLSWHLADRSD